MSKFRSFSVVFILIGFLILLGFRDTAFAQTQCGVDIVKEAPGGGDTEFSFEFEQEGKPGRFNLTDQQPSPIIYFGSNIKATELPLEGWVLRSIRCEGDDAILFNITDNGFTAECNSGDFSLGTCTFFNVNAVSNIPTLSEWGMISVAAGLGSIGLFFAVRRKRAAA